MSCARHVSEITFTRYAQNRKIGKLNILKEFGSNKTKGPKQDSLNRFALGRGMLVLIKKNNNNLGTCKFQEL